MNLLQISVILPYGTDDLLMPLVAYNHRLKSCFPGSIHLAMNAGYHGTGCIYHGKISSQGLLLHGNADTVGRKDQHGALGNLSYGIYKNCSRAAQILNHVTIVHHLV